MNGNVIIAVVLFLCVLLSAFFSCTETAFSSVNTVRLRHSAENGNKKAKSALYIIDNYDKAITAVLIGNNIVNLGGSSLATLLCINIFGDIGAAVATGVTTLVILTFGEIIPKCFAKQKADSIVLATTGILKALIFTLYPLIMLFGILKTAVLGLVKTDAKEPSVTEDELKYIVESIEEEGVLEEQESKMVRRALAFDEETVASVLTPRVDITAVDISENAEKIKNLIAGERYSRIPVYKGNLDNIVGILHTRDYLEALCFDKASDLTSLIQEPFFIYKNKKLSAVLNEFKKNKLHIAVVTDEYGGTLGIVTMEDLLEELVGEIWDEDEEIEKSIIKLGENEYLVSGDLLFSRFTELFEKDCGSVSSSTTVGGFIFNSLGQIPIQGQSLEFDGLVLTVSEISEQRITRVNVKKISV